MKRTAAITWLDKPLRETKQQRDLWTGSISAESKILKNRLKLKSYKEYLAGVNDYYFDIYPSASVRCIDGRKSRHTANIKTRDELIDESLGPQVPGGSLVVAVSHRIAEWNSLAPGTFTEDVASIITLYEKLSLPSPTGAHDDNHAKFPNTGCGALDRMPEIIDRIVDPRSRKVIKAYVKAIVGLDYDEAEFKIAMRVYKVLDSPKTKKTYLLQGPDGEYHYKEKGLQLLKTRAGKSVETMTGTHNEIAVVINFAKGTTFHRDLFDYDSKNEAQIFNYDYWHSVERAKAVYVDKPDLFKRFLISRVIYAIGTAMVLTDGSLALGIRQ